MNTRWSPFVKQLLTVSILIIGVWLTIRVRVLWTPLLLVFLLAFLSSYPVNAIIRRTGWPRTLVVVIVFVLLIVLIGIATANIVPKLIGMSNGLYHTLLRGVDELARVTPAPIELTPTLSLNLSTFYAPIRESLQGILEPDPVTLQKVQDLLFPFASGAAAVVISAVSGVLGTLFVLVVSFYLVKDWPRIGRFFLVRAPQPFRPELRRLWSELASTWDGFIRGQFIASLIMGVAVGVVQGALGVRNAMALGLLAALGELVPIFGPFISATVGTLIALTFGSFWLRINNLWLAVIVLAAYISLGQIQNLLVIPHAIGRRIALHPVVMIVGALVGAELMGILGVLMAAPTVASLRVLVGYGYSKLLDEDPFPPVPQPGDRKALWREQLQSRGVKAVLFDLDGTLIETDDVVVQRLAERLSFLERLLPVATRQRTARRLLMSSEVCVNGFVTLLDRLSLDRIAFRLNDALHRWRGIRTQDRFVAVDGAPETLARLAARYPLGIVTSRSRAESTAFLAQYELTGMVSVLIARDDSPRLKPHPMPIRLAAAGLGVPPEQCVMVGDTGVDTRSAKAAGALSIGVLCGFGDPGDLNNADLVLDSTAQVSDWL